MAEKKKARTYNKPVPHEKFVATVLVHGGELDEIASALGVTKSTVRNRHASMVKKGVHLPRLLGARRELDVDYLNAMIESYEEKGPEAVAGEL